MYALYSENYQLETDGDVIVKYMDNGYYEKIEEYAIEEIPVLLTVGDCNSQDVLCVSAITSYSHNDLLVIAPTRVYSESELAQLNQD